MWSGYGPKDKALEDYAYKKFFLLFKGNMFVCFVFLNIQSSLALGITSSLCILLPTSPWPLAPPLALQEANSGGRGSMAYKTFRFFTFLAFFL